MLGQRGLASSQVAHDAGLRAQRMVGGLEGGQGGASVHLALSICNAMASALSITGRDALLQNSMRLRLCIC